LSSQGHCLYYSPTRKSGFKWLLQFEGTDRRGSDLYLTLQAVLYGQATSYLLYATSQLDLGF
jgi:hypothetical protein